MLQSMGLQRLRHDLESKQQHMTFTGSSGLHCSTELCPRICPSSQIPLLPNMFIELKVRLHNTIRKTENDHSCKILLEQQIVAGKILMCDYLRWSWLPKFSFDFRDINIQNSKKPFGTQQEKKKGGEGDRDTRRWEDMEEKGKAY